MVYKLIIALAVLESNFEFIDKIIDEKNSSKALASINPFASKSNNEKITRIN